MNRREDKPSPLCQTWDAAMACRAGVVYIPRDFCCPVIAALLFPDMEPPPWGQHPRTEHAETPTPRI